MWCQSDSQRGVWNTSNWFTILHCGIEIESTERNSNPKTLKSTPVSLLTQVWWSQAFDEEWGTAMFTPMATRELRQLNYILPLRSPTLVSPNTVSYRDSTSCTNNENNSVNSTEVSWGHRHPHRDGFHVQKPSGIERNCRIREMRDKRLTLCLLFPLSSTGRARTEDFLLCRGMVGHTQ